MNKGPAIFWKVASASGKEPYTVRLIDLEEWRCNCRAFIYGNGKNCKHIAAAQGWFMLGFEGTRDNPAFITVPIVKKKKGKKMILRPDFDDILDRFGAKRAVIFSRNEIEHIVRYATEIEWKYAIVRKAFFADDIAIPTEEREAVERKLNG